MSDFKRKNIATMIIYQKLLEDLSAQAKANPRLRQSYDLRISPDEKS